MKNNKSKRIFAMCLAATILLTGCSNSTNTNTTTPAQTQSTTVATTTTETEATSSEPSYQGNAGVWTGTEFENPANQQKFEQLVSRVITDLEAQGIEVIDDTKTEDDTTTTESNVSEGAIQAPIESDEDEGESSETSSEVDAEASSEVDAEASNTASEGTATTETRKHYSSIEEAREDGAEYLELVSMYPLLKQLYYTDPGNNLMTFISKITHIAEMFDPSAKYDSSDIKPVLRDCFYKEHSSWIPAQWEVIVNSETSLDNYPTRVSGIYSSDFFKKDFGIISTDELEQDESFYMADIINLAPMLGYMYSCPSDEDVANAPKLNNWTIIADTTTDSLYKGFATTAEKWGIQDRGITKIFNGLDTYTLPVLWYREYYNTTLTDGTEKERINFIVDKTDYYNPFFSIDNKLGWTTGSYARKNALQITLYQFLSKLSTQASTETPALAAYLSDNMTHIYDEVQKIIADPTGSYLPVYDKEAIKAAEDEMWFKFEAEDESYTKLLDEGYNVNTPKNRIRVTEASYNRYKAWIASQEGDYLAPITQSILSQLSNPTQELVYNTESTEGTAKTETNASDVSATETETNASNVSATETETNVSATETDLDAYTYLTKDIAMKDGEPIAWTALLEYIKQGMLEKDEKGISLYSGAWKELNSIVDVDNTSFEGMFYSLQNDTAVSNSNYGMLFSDGLSATITCGAKGGVGTYDWYIQWVFAEGRVTVSEIRETLLNYVILVGAFTGADYTNSIDLALTGAVNKASSGDYVFGIDYTTGVAMLTLAKV